MEESIAAPSLLPPTQCRVESRRKNNMGRATFPPAISFPFSLSLQKDILRTLQQKKGKKTDLEGSDWISFEAFLRSAFCPRHKKIYIRKKVRRLFLGKQGWCIFHPAAKRRCVCVERERGSTQSPCHLRRKRRRKKVDFKVRRRVSYFVGGGGMYCVCVLIL